MNWLADGFLCVPISLAAGHWEQWNGIGAMCCARHGDVAKEGRGGSLQTHELHEAFSREKIRPELQHINM